jgi:hypothetical protein
MVLVLPHQRAGTHPLIPRVLNRQTPSTSGLLGVHNAPGAARAAAHAHHPEDRGGESEGGADPGGRDPVVSDRGVDAEAIEGLVEGAFEGVGESRGTDGGGEEEAGSDLQIHPISTPQHPRL